MDERTLANVQFTISPGCNTADGILYRKDGTTFWLTIRFLPTRNEYVIYSMDGTRMGERLSITGDLREFERRANDLY